MLVDVILPAFDEPEKVVSEDRVSEDPFEPKQRALESLLESFDIFRGRGNLVLHGRRAETLNTP